MFWSIKNFTEVLDKLPSRGFRASSVSTYDFSTLYTTLSHNLIKRKLINLIETTFHLACDDKTAFSLLQMTENGSNFGLAKRFATLYLLDNIYIRFVGVVG